MLPHDVREALLALAEVIAVGAAFDRALSCIVGVPSDDITARIERIEERL